MRPVVSALGLVFIAGALIWVLAGADEGAEPKTQRATPSVGEDPSPAELTMRGELASPAGVRATVRSSHAGTMAVELSRGRRLGGISETASETE
jgi:hypothetical protein